MMNGCYICNCEKQGGSSSGGYYYNDKEVELVSGRYARIVAGRDAIGRIYVEGVGDDRTDRYYPKFCPNCGAQLVKKTYNKR